jgi:ectoine hydroxylase-related dioxygenase (phytanoyl-CoA dioxygenase family)
MIRRFKTSEELATIALALREDGIVIVEELFAPELIDQLCDEVAPHLAPQEPGGGVFFGKRVKRLAGLFQHGRAIEALVSEPLLIELVGAMLLPNCLNFRLGLTSALQNFPGGEDQPLHRDGDIYHPYAKVDGEALVSVMIAGSDFTKANGGTRIAVGSHLWPRERMANEPEVHQVEMPRGSAAIWLGNTLHGLALNRDAAPRLGIVLGYALGWLRQEQEQLLIVPPERAAAMPPEVRKIIGYQTHGPFLGWKTGNDPSGFDLGTPEDLSHSHMID